MATGTPPFRGESYGVISSAILERTPVPLVRLNPDLPVELERIIARALEKDRNLRYQHASEIRAELQCLKRDTDTGRVSKASSGSMPTVPESEPQPAIRQPIAAPIGVVPDVLAVKRRNHLKILLASVVLLGALIAGGLYSRFYRTKPLSNKDTIVLGDFDNKTGDPVFDDTLKQGLSVQLEQSPFLELISERKVNQTLKLMGRSEGAKLTPELTREVCFRTGSKAMLTGSIASLGSQYVMGLKAVNCSNGDVLAEAQDQAGSKEEVLKALDNAAVTLRGKLGESLASVQKYTTPVEEATTPSLEALKAYSLGRKTFFTKGNTAALPFYKHAVELDPNFALAYRAMAAAYASLSEETLETENLRKAYELRQKVSERERFYIEGNYYYRVTGELEKALEAHELWQQSYPRDYAVYVYLGAIYASLGNLEKALEEYQEALRLDPNNVVNYEDLGSEYLSLNRLDDAEAVFKQAVALKLESEGLLTNRYLLGFLKGDTAQMSQLLSEAKGKPGTEDALLYWESDTEAYYGRAKSARQVTQRAMISAEQNGAKETAAYYQAEAAFREAELGDRDSASADAREAVNLAPNRNVLTMSALALAGVGDTAGAQTLADELNTRFPAMTVVQKYRLPAIRAAIALQQKYPNRAVEFLQLPEGIDLGDYGLLIPVYERGQAFLMLHDGNHAAAEFQKFIEHRGLVANFLLGAMARLQLGRAYAMVGNTAEAKAAYQEFLNLWTDADPNITVLKEAKMEYAKLQ